MNISSIIVKTRPEHYDAVWLNLQESPLCEVHFGDKEKGIIIITIEGENVEEEIEKLYEQQRPMYGESVFDWYEDFNQDQMNYIKFY